MKRVPDGQSPIAIIGMSAIFPGARNLDEYWENILAGKYTVTEVPPERWLLSTYFDENPKTRDRIYSRWGGFVEPVEFDPLRYSIPPKALETIDPCQILTLEMVDRALRDADLLERGFDRENTSCFVGEGGGLGNIGQLYALRSLLPMYMKDIPEEVMSQLPEWTEDSFPGLLPNVIAGRIANQYDLGGTNLSTSAACAAGLAALSLGMDELRAGKSNVSICAAVDVQQNPFIYLCFSKTMALSPTGKPRCFDEEGDGIVISQGVGAVVLKRLADAQRDGDRIYAVLSGLGTSSDGRGKSLTSPTVKGQIRAMKRAYDQAGFELSTLGLIEAHGTGTVLGDRTEAQSISEALQDAGAPPAQCAIGTVKSMIGHTKGCAGIAGLVKVALALRHQLLPSTLWVEKPTAGELWGEDSPAYLNTELRPWIDPGYPRRAAVNSFGFGGTNFHAVLQEYPQVPEEARRFPVQELPAELFCFRGPSVDAILEDVSRLEKQVAERPDLPVAALETFRNLSERPEGKASPCRLAILAESVEDLRKKLARVRARLADHPETFRDPTGISFSSRPVGFDGKVAFLFPGQGSQRVDMLRDLAVYFAEVREALALADRALDSKLPRRLSQFVYPPARFSEEQEKAAMAALTRTEVAQPALGAMGMAVQRVLEAFGVQPDMTAGHSSGEYSALCAAGVFPEEELYRLLWARGTCMVEACGEEAGTMLAVRGPRATIEALCADREGLYPANFNAPLQTVISGRREDLEALLPVLEEKDMQARFIPVACGFHSPFVADAAKAFEVELARVRYAAPQVPTYSNFLAAPFPEGDDEVRKVLSSHLSRPVRFMDEIERMHDDGARVFLELGVGRVCATLAGDILEDRPFAAISTDGAPSRHGLTRLLHALGQLFSHGVEVKLDPLFDRRRIVTEIPEKPKLLWMVSPEVSWPASQERPVIRAVSSSRPSPAEVPASAAPTPPEPTRPAAPIPPAPPTAAASPPRVAGTPAALPTGPQPAGRPPASVGGAGRITPQLAEVILRHQQLMTSFLDQQRQVMMTYLGQQTGATSVPVEEVRAEAPLARPAAAPISPVSPEPVVARPAPPTPQAAPATAPAEPAVGRAEMEAALMALVAERTGYPTEMLERDQDLEADLGIDSIKRVEILTAFAKQLPTLDTSATEKLQGARTLEDVLAIVAAGVSPPSAPIQAAEIPPAGTTVEPATEPETALQTGAAPSRFSESELLGQLTALIAERTGYPMEMLEADQDLEADLGIDSIKRVEILTSFAKQFPDLAASATERLQAARTLGDVLEVVVDSLPGAAGLPTSPSVPPPPPRLEPTQASRSELLEKLTALIADRTGYPVEMLEPDQDLEADLGIDSIKRVEILTTFAKEFPDLATSATEKLQQARTLGDVLEVVLDRGPVAAEPVPTATPARTAAAAPTVETNATTSGPGATGSADAASLQAALTQLIAERTGYPEEMLEIDQDLESDLGIDSIKRVEILTAFGKQLPDLPPDASEPLQQARTMGDIIQAILQHGGTGPAPAPAAGESPEATATEEGDDLDRFVISMKEATLPNGIPPRIPAGAILITDDETGCALAMQRQLRALGGKPMLIRPAGNEDPANDVFVADPSDPDAVENLVQKLRSKHGSIGGILHLLPLQSAPSVRDLPAAAWQQMIDQEVKGLFYLLRSAAADLQATPGTWAVTALSFGGGGEDGTLPVPEHPWRGGAVGIIKTVAVEWPDVIAKSVILEDPSPEQAPHQILAELTGPVEQLESYHRGSVRRVPDPIKMPLNGVGPSVEITRDDVVVLIGGARGITAEAGLEISRRHHPTMILVGRSDWPDEEAPDTAGIEDEGSLKKALMERMRAEGKMPRPADVGAASRRIRLDREMRATKAAMEAAGSRVFYYPTDLRDEEATVALFERIYATHGRVDGVISGAGIIEDKLIQDKGSESFDRVFDTKARAIFHLSRALRAESLKFLVIFSSVAGWTGNRGQVDYVAANEVLNRMALHLHESWKTRVVAVDWGPWGKAGMVDEGIRKQFLARGVGIVSPVSGRRYLVDEIRFGRPGDSVVAALGRVPDSAPVAGNPSS